MTLDQLIESLQQLRKGAEHDYMGQFPTNVRAVNLRIGVAHHDRPWAANTTANGPIISTTIHVETTDDNTP